LHAHYTLSHFLACILYNMSGAEHNGLPLWLLDTFCDPIWQHDQRAWRRYPASASGVSGDDSHDSLGEFLRPRYPHSEPDRDRPVWFSTRYTPPQDSRPMESFRGSTEVATTDLRTIMSRVADPYWANRGWVLHLVICWKKTSANWFYRRRSDSLKRKSSKQIPPNSPRHSARRSSSSNWYAMKPRAAGGYG
jgi:hypothetical protein